MSILISPSLLSADFLHLEKDLEMINQSEADWLHLDIMDGVFVPNISFGFPVIDAVAKVCKKPLDVHLMIVQPERYVERVAKTGAMMMNVHYEACTHLHRTIQEIHDAGVNPGFGGQKFIPNTTAKLKRLRKLIDESGSKAIIQIDGGVTDVTAPPLVEAGADCLVSGSYIFKQADPIATIKGLKKVK